MQSLLESASHQSWIASIAVAIIVALVTNADRLYNAIRGRKKVDADTRRTDAEALKLEADATKTYNDIIRDIRRELNEAERKWELEKKELIETRDHWKDRFEMIEIELEKFRHGGNGKG